MDASADCCDKDRQRHKRAEWLGILALLWRELTPDNRSKSLAWRRALLSPKFPTKEADFSTALQEWDTDLDKYEAEYGQTKAISDEDSFLPFPWASLRLQIFAVAWQPFPLLSCLTLTSSITTATSFSFCFRDHWGQLVSPSLACHGIFRRKACNFRPRCLSQGTATIVVVTPL